MSIVIGLTGPTGAGKSSAAEIARSLGIKVIDCDAVARQAVIRESDGLKALTVAFGDGILNADGTLDRHALAKAAFSSKEKTQLLNETILPFISALVAKEAGSDDVILDAPTLFESGMGEECTDTVAVLADRDVRIKRIISRDGLTIDDALLRINAGKPDDFYTERAGHILYGDSEDFLTTAEVLFKRLFGGKENE